MIPLIGERWTFLLKASYLVPLAAYVWVLFTLESLMVFDWVAFGVTLVGTALVVKAKRDLAAHHTWTGYCLPNSNSSQTASTPTYGTHSTQAYNVVWSLLHVVPHVNWQATSTLAVTSIICMAYIMGFLAFLANKETKLLMLYTESLSSTIKTKFTLLAPKKIQQPPNIQRLTRTSPNRAQGDL
jgi:hypothetical protein